MKSDQLSFRPGFRLSVANAKSQAAVMVLAVGGKEGGSDNLHKGADQWLYVVEGSGVAIINGHKTRLKAGTIVLIEAGDRHEIRNTGRTLLKTVSVYVPPAYRNEENELPAGRGGVAARSSATQPVASAFRKQPPGGSSWTTLTKPPPSLLQAR